MTTDDVRADLDRYCERLKNAAHAVEALGRELQELATATPPGAENGLLRGRLDDLWTALGLGAADPRRVRDRAESWGQLAGVAVSGWTAGLHSALYNLLLARRDAHVAAGTALLPGDFADLRGQPGGPAFGPLRSLRPGHPAHAWMRPDEMYRLHGLPCFVLPDFGAIFWPVDPVRSMTRAYADREREQQRQREADREREQQRQRDEARWRQTPEERLRERVAALEARVAESA
jgi:hypothetical protein